MQMNPIYDANNLYNAAIASKKGSGETDEVRRFMWMWLLNITELQDDLKNQTYHDSKGEEFIINERGHTRAIVAKSMRDRVVRHSLCDNVLTPNLSPKLIYANCASQVNKGIDLQRKILVEHLRNYYAHYGNDGYVLEMDFSNFYDNVRHQESLDMLKEIIDDEYAIWLTEKILKGFEVDVSYLTDAEYKNCMNKKFNSIEYRENIPKCLHTGNKMMRKSLDIGDQTSQDLSIFYPYKIDNYVKIVRGVKYYGRYMDDSYIIAPTKEELWDIYAGIKEIADSLGIFINEKKTHITKLSNGFRFLQIKYILTDSGKVIQKINQKRITAMRRKLKKLAVKVKNGERNYKDIENMFKGWMGSHHKYMSRRQKENMYGLFNKLFKTDLKWVHDGKKGAKRSGHYESKPYIGSVGRNNNSVPDEREQFYNRSGYQLENSF